MPVLIYCLAGGGGGGAGLLGTDLFTSGVEGLDGGLGLCGGGGDLCGGVGLDGGVGLLTMLILNYMFELVRKRLHRLPL